MQHLLALGHRRIALIDPRADPLAFQDPGERQAGYRQALVVTGLPLRPAYEGVTDYSLDTRQGPWPLAWPCLTHRPPCWWAATPRHWAVLAAARVLGVWVPEVSPLPTTMILRSPLPRPDHRPGANGRNGAAGGTAGSSK